MSSAVESSVSTPASNPPPPPPVSESNEEEQVKEASGSAPESSQKEEPARVKVRRARTTTPTKDTELVELPEDLDIFWLPEEALSVDATPNPDLPPPEIFEEALNKLLITLHPQVQHRATYPPDSDPPVEPTLGLYCPIEGGEYIIDATVRELARSTGAEVLVLDSVQLAAGEWGHFGKAANALQLPSNPLHFPSDTQSPFQARSETTEAEEHDDEDGTGFPSPQMMTLTLLAPQQGRGVITPSARRAVTRSKIKVFFDTLVNSTPKSSATEATSSSPNRPRIIYIRDFATLAASSSVWYPPLLSAVRQRRRGPMSRPSSPVLNPITIVFGMTPPLTPPVSTGIGPHLSLVNHLLNRQFPPSVSPQDPKPERIDWSESDAAEKARERSSPKLSTTTEDDGSDAQKPEIIVLGSPPRGIPGLPPMMAQPQPSRGPRSGDSEKRTTFFRTAVLVPSKRSHTQERLSRMARRREINELCMRMGVGAVGGSVEESPAAEVVASSEEQDALSEKSEAEVSTESATSENPEPPTPLMWDDWGNRIEVWSNVKKIADSAVGRALSVAALSADKSLDATVVPWDYVQSAWLARKSLRDQKRSWLKDAGSLSTQDLEEAKASADEAATDEVVERVRNDADLDPYEQRLLGSIVDSASMPTSFSHVHLPPHIIDSVRTIVSLPLLHPHAFQTGILKQHSMTGCLLFGPPGTGKTLVVRALAKEAGCRMLAITPSDIMDMYVGEAEKLVRAVFSLARRLSPCVVFLDEIDALFGARMAARESGGAAAAHRGVITEFMQEMDGLKSSKEDGIIVIGATNRPFDLDDAVLRRLPRRLLVDLPGEKERAEILKILLRDEDLASDVTPLLLAKKTESFSGSDLKPALDAVKERVHVPWKQSPAQAPSESSGNDAADSSNVLGSVSSSPSAPPELAESGKSEPTRDASQTTEPIPHTRVLHLHNFLKALKEITPSSSESLGSLSELRKWNDEFGEGRKGKRKSPWGRGLFGFIEAKKPIAEESKVATAPSSPASTSP
ncbi:hypothetical protein H1R20_g376, partial [Candolleomyces eurysporus]